MVSWTLELRGLRLGHERHFKDGLCSWLHVGSGQYGALPDEIEPKSYSTVVHLVRNPLDTIVSTAFTESGMWETEEGEWDRKRNRATAEFMKMNCPELPEVFPEGAEDEYFEERFRFHMAAWIGWNRKIERELAPAVRLQVERMQEQWEVWMDVFGPPVSWDRRPPFNWTVKPNARAHPKLSWADLERIDEKLSWEVRKVGNEYGY